MEITAIAPAHAEALARFFELLKLRGVDKMFHPHPLTAAAARERAGYAGRDMYCVLVERDEIFGYGMLRGWDEGYEIPSLGIVIHPDVRGKGLGRLLMIFLHTAALRRGAKKIRLRVEPENQAAMTLYRSLGYQFKWEKDGRSQVGFLNLTKAAGRRITTNR